MIDINKLVADSLSKMQSEGKIESLIEKHLSAALNNVVSGLFVYNSEIHNELQKAFKEQIKVDLSQLTLPEYNKKILAMIQKTVDSNIHTKGLQKLEGDLKEMLSGSTPDELKVSDLICEFAEGIYSRDDDKDWDGEIAFHYESDKIVKGYFNFFFDEEPGKDKYGCAYCVRCDNEGKIYRCTINGVTNETLRIGKIYGIDRRLFQLYSTGARIIPDFDNVLTHYDYNEE